MYTHENGITLRKVEHFDLSDLQSLKDESWWGTHHLTIVNCADQNKWFENLDNNKELVLMAKTGRDKVGVYILSNIDWISRSYDASYSVFENFRKKGYGFKIWQAGTDFGFKMLNMHRITAEVLSTNEASNKIIYDRAGFTQEGIKEKAIFKQGKYIDSIVYGMLVDNWRNRLENLK